MNGWKITAAFFVLLAFSGAGEIIHIISDPKYPNLQVGSVLMGAVMVFLFMLVAYKAWKLGTNPPK